jgi:hypothetical protein
MIMAAPASDIKARPRRAAASIVATLFFLVFEDENDFAWPNKAELLASHGLNGGRIFVQPSYLVAELGVGVPEGVQRGPHLPIVATRPHRLHEPLLANKGINNEHQRYKNEQEMDATPP